MSSAAKHGVQVAEVRLWGRTIGAVSLGTGTGGGAGDSGASGRASDIASFEYDPDFAQSGIEIAPLKMPLSRTVYRFPGLSRTTYHGLPGLLSDSLPDRFGSALIDAWLATQGRRPAEFTAIERLCYTGERGTGALEYRPVVGPRERRPRDVEIDRLVELASQVLSQRSSLNVSLDQDGGLSDILRVGTSAGGARAKAVIAWNPQTNRVRSGQLPADRGFEHWLLKFDGVRGNKDKELEDPQGYGVIEYAYSKMARDCGITMSECRLFEEGGRRHFMTRRFDRDGQGRKLHMQSLGALAHFDFALAGAHSYEQALLVILDLGLPKSVVEEQLRRMVFNLVARNQDDHVKNIAFLMDRDGQWSLSPAFDLTYSYNPSGAWTSQHQMSVNGRRDGFSIEDLRACAGVGGLGADRCDELLREVVDVVARWGDYADEAGLRPEWRDQISQQLRLQWG
jgi:serine/threonine-protein kinase HipA